MAERDVRERDILVASNEYAYVQDLTKGDIVLYVGPTKISLSNTERLVDFREGRFQPVRSDEASGTHPFVVASAQEYVIVENPPRDPAVKAIKGSNSATELLVGKKIVVPGPVTFPLWPGQRAEVVRGHTLREDEYLLVRVYDEVGGGMPIGRELVIRGAEVSYYVPTNGLEVIPREDGGGYVRRAFRLRRNRGLHLRVIKDFTVPEPGGADESLPPGAYTAGQDVFVKDREGFFFPSEHAIVVRVVEALPLAEKEGLYVRDILSGRITTVKGPTNYLVDPTREDVVGRELDPDRLRLYRNKTPAFHGAAISIDIPPSTAVMVVAKDKREVVLGPGTRILDFEEELEVLHLSTGKPKDDAALLPTCFLRVDGNKVSDVVKTRTQDHVELELQLSYRVSFVSRHVPADRWFAVTDYVALLCDHLASLLRAAARRSPLDEVYRRGAELVRDAVLGEKTEGEPRAGRHFAENGMWVYDVEVLELRVLDPEVRKLLLDAQKAAIVMEVSRKSEENRARHEKVKEAVTQEIYLAQIATQARAVDLENAKNALVATRLEAQAAHDRLERIGRAENEAQALEIGAAARARVAERELEIEARRLEGRVQAFEKEMAAMAPELVTTLRALGHQEFAKELARTAAPLAILGGSSVTEVVERLLGALPVAASETVTGVLAASASAPNGNAKRP